MVEAEAATQGMGTLVMDWNRRSLHSKFPPLPSSTCGWGLSQVEPPVCYAEKSFWFS